MNQLYSFYILSSHDLASKHYLHGFVFPVSPRPLSFPTVTRRSPEKNGKRFAASVNLTQRTLKTQKIFLRWGPYSCNWSRRHLYDKFWWENWNKKWEQNFN